MLNASKIRSKRKALKMSLAEAAVAAGWGKIGRTRWHDIEKGRRNNLTLETLEKMAGALKCNPEELLA